MAAYLPDPTRNAYMGATAEKIRRPYSSEELWAMFDPWRRRRDIINLSPREVRLLATIDALEAERDRLRDALECIVHNAVEIPDPRMDGTTDCYAVPLDDIGAARAALAVRP